MPLPGAAFQQFLHAEGVAQAAGDGQKFRHRDLAKKMCSARQQAFAAQPGQGLEARQARGQACGQEHFGQRPRSFIGRRIRRIGTRNGILTFRERHVPIHAYST